MGVVTDGSGAVKHDGGKAPWDLLPWDAVEAVVHVLAAGAQEYSARNWERGLAHSRTFSAAQRHLVDFFQRGLREDPDSGLHPLAHAACEILFALAFELRGQREAVDDTPGTAARRRAPWPTGLAAAVRGPR